MMVYKLFWDEFSSWYLEIIKPAYQQPIDAKTLQSTLAFFDSLMRLLHPFMPFITEEIWQVISERKDGESIVISEMPKAIAFDTAVITDFENAKVLVSEIRTVRKEKNIPLKDALSVFVNANQKQSTQFDTVVCKLTNVTEIKETTTEIPGAVSFRVKKVEFYIPLEGKIDIAEEIKKINEELVYIQGFLASVEKKLSNENFVSKAPAAVLDVEYKKKADALDKIAMLESRLQSLK
jgi:valyl-tRNA synthetase